MERSNCTLSYPQTKPARQAVKSKDGGSFAIPTLHHKANFVTNEPIPPARHPNPQSREHKPFPTSILAPRSPILLILPSHHHEPPPLPLLHLRLPRRHLAPPHRHRAHQPRGQKPHATRPRRLQLPRRLPVESWQRTKTQGRPQTLVRPRLHRLVRRPQRPRCRSHQLLLPTRR